jgi:hypothetical protein
MGAGNEHRRNSGGGRFLYHLAIYTRQTYGTRLHILSISDNKGLVTRVCDRRNDTMVYANATLTADWDLTEQIHQTFEEAKIPRHSYEWVKGHQDDHRDYESLPVPAQYNIRADELADIYMEIYNPSHLLSPLLPAARCNFAIAHTTHQGHYTKAIRHQLALPPLFEFLRGRRHWRDGVETTIAWNSFQEAANNYHTTDNHLMKLVYDKLPTRKRKSVASTSGMLSL